MQATRDTRQLNWFLAWAVVFCDIGTSVYYVPGILYGSVGDKTPFFVLLTTLGFVPLALKYIEITWRNPEGGGVVTITTKALGPMWGCLGGMLITTSYFLTAAISAVSGFHYIGAVLPPIDDYVVVFACVGLFSLAVLNIIGIRESATVAFAMAITAFVVNLVVIVGSLSELTPAQWRQAFVSSSPGYVMAHHFGWFWSSVARVLGTREYQPIKSRYALPAPAHGALGNGRRDRYDDHHFACPHATINQYASRGDQSNAKRAVHLRDRRPFRRTGSAGGRRD
jgi:amino acid transporter